MAAPFVISMKFVADGSAVPPTTRELRQEVDRLSTALGTSRTRATELQSALSDRSTAAGLVATYEATVQQIRAEQLLESQRLGAQISDKGRADSINRLAQLARDGAAAAQALARAEGEATAAQLRMSEAAGRAAASVQQLAAQQERVAALNAAGLNARLGVRDSFGTASRGADVEAYGRELDELRARFSPLFAAEQRHLTNVQEIQRAYRVGAISIEERVAALRSEEAAYRSAAVAISGNTELLERNQAVRMSRGGDSFATANIAAQFQDIGVTSAMGMSPLQIALQQGTQLSAVLTQLKSDGQGVGATLASAFMSVISPVSLLTIGLVGLSAVAIQVFSGMMAASADATVSVEDQAEALKTLLKGYDEAGEAASRAIQRMEKLPRGVVLSDLGKSLREQEKSADELQAKIDASARTLRDNANFIRQFQDIGENLGSAPSADLAAMLQQVELIEQLGLSARSTVPEIQAAMTAARELYNTAEDPAVRELADQAYQLGLELLRSADAAYAARAALAALNNGDLLSAVTADAKKVADSIETIVRLRPELRSDREQARDALNAVLGSSTDGVLRLTAQQEYRKTIAALDEQDRRAEAERAARLAQQRAGQISDYERAIASIRERTETQRVETNVIGLGTFAVEKARVALELENAARKDAIGLTPERIAQIDAEASAYARTAAAQEAVREKQQAVTEQTQFYKSTFNGFFTSLFSLQNSAATGWERLADAGVSALDRIAQRALGMAADGIFDMLFGALLGSVGGGGWSQPGRIAGSANLLNVGQFDTGGWTGGTRGRAAGIVHGEEFVVRAGPAAAYRDTLEAMNAGRPIGGGSGFTFAPNSYFTLTGGQGDMAAFQQLLDERDARLNELFESKVAAYLANPLRRAA